MLPYWSVLILHVGRGVISSGTMELEDYWLMLSQWNILEIFIKRKKEVQSALSLNDIIKCMCKQSRHSHNIGCCNLQMKPRFSCNFIILQYMPEIVIFECHLLVNIFIYFSIMDHAWYPACGEPLCFISLHALCFFLSFNPPAVLKDFRSNIWWGSYRVIASYQWPTQCRACLRINGPTRRIQWLGKERAHSTSSLSLRLTDEIMIQSLLFIPFFLMFIQCPALMKQHVTSFYHLVLVIIMLTK